MLALTERAVDVIKQAVEGSELADGAGLRIAAQPDPTGGSAGLGAQFAEAPKAEDEVVEIEGARVFLDPAATPQLDEMVLDAEVEPTGGVRFGVTPQQMA